MTTRHREAAAFSVRAIPQGLSQAERVDVSNLVISMSYEDLENAADKLTLTVNNFDLEQFDSPIFRKGGTLEVQWGYAGDMTPTRTVVIQSVKGAQVLTVEGLAKSILMNKVQRVRSFKNMTRAQVVAQVATENGYGAEAQQIDDTQVIFPVIQQARETDAQFLKRLAGREGWQFFVDFDGLHFHERKLGQRPLRDYTFYIDQTGGDVKSFNVENDVTAKPASVKVVGKDPLTKKAFTETASDSTVPRHGLGEQLEIVDPVTGATHLQAGTGTSSIAPSSEPNAAAAARAAAGTFKNAQLTAVLLTMQCVGDPGQVAKSIVTVNGIRSLSGKYYVSAVRHTLSQTGAYDMEMKLKRDGRSLSTQKAAASSAAQNNKGAADPNALSPKEIVDPVTGSTKTIYVDSRGRDNQ